MRPLEVDPPAPSDQLFVKFNEAYRRIVHYRKQMRDTGRCQPRGRNDENASGVMESFEQIRKRLGTLNCDMQDNFKGKHPSESGFASEINRIYE
jgi:hypothetical protein